MAVNSKEYYKPFEDISFNKKHKGIKKGLPGMDFENYTDRILALNDCDVFEKPKADMKQVARLTSMTVKCNKNNNKTIFSIY